MSGLRNLRDDGDIFDAADDDADEASANKAGSVAVRSHGNVCGRRCRPTCAGASDAATRSLSSSRRPAPNGAAR
jgi:hypothetical protein